MMLLPPGFYWIFCCNYTLENQARGVSAKKLIFIEISQNKN